MTIVRPSANMASTRFLKNVPRCTRWGGGEFIHPQWRLGCYWEQLYGFHPYVGVENMEEEARKWLYNPVKLGGFFTEEEYASEIYGEARAILAQYWRAPKDIPTMSEWLATGRWVRGRAGTGQKTTISIDGKQEKSRSMKGVDAALMSDEEIGRELKTAVPEQFHVMEESEEGKSRLVVKTSNESNRKMDFLSEVVERGLYSSLFSTLYAGTAGNDAIDLELLELTRDRNYIKVPLDQKNFDQHQSLITIQAVMGAIGDHMSQQDIPSEYAEVWAALWDSIFVIGGTVTVGKKQFPWRNGLPSGWRWTAFLDTMLNLASCRIIQRVVEVMRGKPCIMKNLTVQGDDVIFGSDSLLAIRLVVASYIKIGYEIHPMKTFLSDHRGEFLRRSYELQGITGYNTRTLLSIRFMNPIQDAPILPVE